MLLLLLLCCCWCCCLVLPVLLPDAAAAALLLLPNSIQNQNKLGLDEVPTLNYGGSDGGGGDSGGEEGDAPAAAADKTIFKLKVTGFGDKAKIKVCDSCRCSCRSSRHAYIHIDSHANSLFWMLLPAWSCDISAFFVCLGWGVFIAVASN